jgi:porphobilinogen synthase
VIRGLVRENIVTPRDFIYPLFIHDDNTKEEISSMPGCYRHSLSSMLEEIEESIRLVL